jgi:hypothetical protein
MTMRVEFAEIFLAFRRKSSYVSSELLTTNCKASTLNLDETKHGTFAGIGAGQEVARQFLEAGGAAGTIAKSGLGLRHEVQRCNLRKGSPIRLTGAHRTHD